MYRHAIELSLKSIVLGDGGHFLKTKLDPISVGKSRAVSWLAQFVVQIVTTLGWEAQFRCEEISNLTDLKAAVGAISDTDPGAYVFRSPLKEASQEAVREFAHRMDALLELLAITGDALAAEWELRKEGIEVDGEDGGGFGQTIQ